MDCDCVGAAEPITSRDPSTPVAACYDDVGLPLGAEEASVPCCLPAQSEPADQCDELCVDLQNCPVPCGDPVATAKMPQCCNCACGRPGCVPMKRVRYVQPPKRESCKPIVTYKAPEVEFGGDSVYKTSYNADPQLVVNARPLPIKPQSHLVPNPGCLEKTTVTATSYPGYHNVERAQPIVPTGNLLQSGPLQEVTTSRHDYVAKTTPKRYKIVPAGHMHVHSAPFEKQTTNKLSYSCPNMASFEPARSCKPLREYERPEVPMQSDTTSKLSYGPICPPPKEDVPWARRACYQPPNVAMDNETTYKKSYMTSHCANERAKMVLPYNNLAVPAGSGFESKTVYKDSYHSAPCGERPPAIRPVVQLRVPNAKLEDDTVYKTSFATHCHSERPAPILPRSATLIGDGPMQEMTTQRHDFVCKGQSKREPIVPQGLLAIPTARLESATENRLAFPANKENIVPTKSCKPILKYKRPEEPMESDTTQKLSYMPVCPPPKEHYPWAQRVRFQAPNVPMESETTSKQSYPPPGLYVEEPCNDTMGCCESCNPAAVNCCGNVDASCAAISYPRAAIVK
uniref:Uncharacterized protein n=1 Tax=Anopheles atroparvus TaxID=41427 RepID=A0AAG5CVH7_ANOAO